MMTNEQAASTLALMHQRIQDEGRRCRGQRTLTLREQTQILERNFQQLFALEMAYEALMKRKLPKF